jgi:hypothetical protein
MKSLRNIGFTMACLLFFAIDAHASATNIYIAQNAAGAANGADCADAKPVSFVNSAGNWGAGSAQIGPGTTAHLCGTFTGAAGSSMITFLGSGASGAPITVLFESGAVLTSPYWGGNSAAAIVCTGQNYITIDGGANGLITNTANGSASLGYSYQQPSQGIQFSSCSHVEVRHLSVTNIYVHANGDNAGENNTQGIGLGYGDFVSVHDNIVTQAYVGIGMGYNTVGSGGNVTSANIFSNTIDHACHLISIGDGTNSSSASGVNVNNNTLGPHFQDWTAANQSCHSDGMIISAYNSGSSITNMNIYNNTISSDMCSILGNPGGNCTGYVFLTGNMSAVHLFNNLFNVTSTLSGFEGMLRFDPAGASMQNFSIYNNVFDANNTNAATAGCDCAAIKTADSAGGTSLSGFAAQNNIFVNFTNAAFLNEIGTFSSAYSAGINHNDFFNTAQVGVDFSGNAHYTTLANWRAAGFDVNGNNVNPSFGTNYVPQVSSVMTMGANLSAVGISALDSDKTGLVRPASGPWAAGAYQGSPSGPAPPTALSATVN